MFGYSKLFIQVLTAEQFFKILSAMLLEISTIFVADNLPVLSSATIGMQCFMDPFKWPHTSIPILPRDLLEIL